MKTNFHADGSTYDPALDKQRLWLYRVAIAGGQ